MRLIGNVRVRPALRRLRSRFRPGVAILGYHRVHDAPDPLGLSVARSRFEQHLAVLTRVARPMRLADVAAELRGGRVPPGAVVLTFDDGYADNLHTLLPLLERYEAPATIFVTTGNRGGEFWWDWLARLLPGGEDSDAWAVRLEHMSAEAREEALRQLESARQPAVRALHRTLTAAELQQLASSPLVEIGAHCVTHARLPMLSMEEQRTEIRDSRAHLEELLSARIASFAYPHGALTRETVAVVEEAGYRTACCSRTDVATASAPPFELPRLWAPNVDGDAFERWLRGWVHPRRGDGDR